jgi:hypothetical protein
VTVPSWRYPDRPTAGSFEGAEHGGGGDEHLRLVAIHAAPSMETTWLDA